MLSASAGGPFKPSFGLSGAVLPLDKVFPPRVRVFGPSILTRSPPVADSRLRSGENCSTPSPPDVRTTQPSPASTPASQKRARWGPRIAMNIAQLLRKLRIIANVEIVIPLLPEMLCIANQTILCCHPERSIGKQSVADVQSKDPFSLNCRQRRDTRSSAHPSEYSVEVR